MFDAFCACDGCIELKGLEPVLAPLIPKLNVELFDPNPPNMLPLDCCAGCELANGFDCCALDAF